ncbi:hypothetical protein ACFL35_06395 [Candidatus Riflebacteria bacterium]
MAVKYSTYQCVSSFCQWAKQSGRLKEFEAFAKEIIFEHDGKRILYSFHAACGKCFFCSSGAYFHCPNQYLPSQELQAITPESKLAGNSQSHFITVPEYLKLEDALHSFVFSRIITIYQRCTEEGLENVYIQGDCLEGFYLWKLLANASLFVCSKREFKKFKKKGRILNLRELISENYAITNLIIFYPTAELLKIPTSPHNIHYFYPGPFLQQNLLMGFRGQHIQPFPYKNWEDTFTFLRQKKTILAKPEEIQTQAHLPYNELPYKSNRLFYFKSILD